jgi:hypothetical protein
VRDIVDNAGAIVEHIGAIDWYVIAQCAIQTAKK